LNNSNSPLSFSVLTARASPLSPCPFRREWKVENQTFEMDRSIWWNWQWQQKRDKRDPMSSMEFAFWLTTSHPSRLTPLATSLHQYSSLCLSQCKLLSHYYDHLLYIHTHTFIPSKDLSHSPPQGQKFLTWGIINLLKSLEYPEGYGFHLLSITIPSALKPFCFFMQHKSLGVSCFMKRLVSWSGLTFSVDMTMLEKYSCVHFMCGFLACFYSFYN